MDLLQIAGCPNIKEKIMLESLLGIIVVISAIYGIKILRSL